MSTNDTAVYVVMAYHSGFGHTARQAAAAVAEGALAVDGVKAEALPMDASLAAAATASAD